MHRNNSNPGKWPKSLPALTPEQTRIRDDFMCVWHEVLPRRYGFIERFNHGYPLRRMERHRGHLATLEVGAGLGAHLGFEELAAQDYVAVELRPDMAARLKRRFPSCCTVVADCQAGLPFDDGCFDRVLAIHVLEHLPDLPSALQEIRRVLESDGQFCVVIPCEGGAVYSFARNISARRLFERRYRQSYDWFVKSEHVNRPAEIVAELTPLFEVTHRSFFPAALPIVGLNLCIGLTLKRRQGTARSRCLH